MEEHVLRLIHDEFDDSFRISVEFKEDAFNLTVLQKLNAWTATVDKKVIVDQAEQLEINIDDYYRKIQEYFTKALANVELKFNDNELIITCKLENKMKMKYFSCKLKEADYRDCVENLMDKLYTEKTNSLRQLKIVDSEKKDLEESKNSLETKLNEFIERKKSDVQELYNNFVLVLNEKKRRIQHLNELLEAFKRGRPTSNPHVEVKKRTKKTEIIPQKKIEIKEEISESESEDNYNTDEEKSKDRKDSSDEDIDDINKNKKTTEPIPSTSKCDYDIFDDDSPPRHLLPKRIKSETMADSNNLNKPSTSKKSSQSNKDAKNNTYNTVDETPNVNFNTQELLDNM